MEGVIAEIRAAPRAIWVFGALVAGVLGLVEAAAIAFTGVPAAWTRASEADGWLWVDASGQVAAIVGQLAISVLSGVSFTLASVLLVAFTARALDLSGDGGRVTVAGVWRAVLPRLAGSLGVAAIAMGVTAALVAIPLAISAMLVLLDAPWIAVVGVAVGISVAAVLAAGWLLPPLAVALPEQVRFGASGSVGTAIATAWSLASGNRWRLIGIWVLATIVLALARGVIALPFGWIATLLTSEQPGGLGAPLMSVLGASVVVALTAPVGAIVLAVVHRRLRGERELRERA